MAAYCTICRKIAMYVVTVDEQVVCEDCAPRAHADRALRQATGDNPRLLGEVLRALHSLAQSGLAAMSPPLFGALVELDVLEERGRAAELLRLTTLKPEIT